MERYSWSWLVCFVYPLVCWACLALESDGHVVTYAAECSNQPTIECTSRTHIVPMYNTMVGRGSVCVDSMSARIKRISIERMHVDIRIDSTGIRVNGKQLLKGGI